MYSLQGDLPHPGMEPMSLKSPALAGGSLPLMSPGKFINDILILNPNICIKLFKLFKNYKTIYFFSMSFHFYKESTKCFVN